MAEADMAHHRFTDNERENSTMTDDKDHLNDEPGSSDLMSTGDGPLKEDDSLDQDQADCPES
jgi:hypothetical protein